MNIKLEIEENGELKEKKFTAKRMRGRHMKSYLEIQDFLKKTENEGTFSVETIDLIVEFICEIFENKFTADEFLDGCNSEDIMCTFLEIGKEMGSKQEAKMEKLIKN